MIMEKKMTKQRILKALTKYFREQRRRGYAPPFDADGKWGWTTILAAVKP